MTSHSEHSPMRLIGRRTPTNPVPPPIFRVLVLFSTAIVLVAVGLIANGPSNIAAQTVPTAIAAPANLIAVPSLTPGEMDVSWDIQTTITASNAKFQIRYRAKNPTGNWVAWTNVPDSTDTGSHTHDESSYTLTGLDPNRPYDVEVRLQVGTVGGTVSTLIDIHAGYQPRNFTLVPGDAPGTLVAKWDRQTVYTGAFATFGYRIKQATSSNWGAFNYIGQAGQPSSYSSTGVTITGLDRGFEYDVRVAFRDSGGWGPAAYRPVRRATASGIPAPTNFSATAGTAPEAVDLSWDLVNGINDLQYRYKLKSAATYPGTGTGSWTSIPDSNDAGTSAGDEVAYTVTGLTAGTEYDFQLRARVSATEFSTSVTDDATAQTQSAPQVFTAYAGTAVGSLNVTFTAPPAGTPTRYDYRYKRASETNYPATWTQVPDINSNNNRVDDQYFDITSLWAGVSYNVQLTVTSSVGTSQPVTVTQTATAQPAPASFIASRGTDPGEIDLSWTAITTGLPTGDSVVNYQYRTKLTSAGASTYTTWTNIPAASTSSHTITGLSTYTLHDVQLRAAIDDGDDADTDTANYYSGVATNAGIRSGLASPANLRATAGTNPGEVGLAWTEQTTFGVSSFPLARYQVRTKVPTASWPITGDLGWTDISGSSGTSNSHTLTGLMASQLYDIQVRFLALTSLTSGPSSVQTTPTAVPTPTGFLATTSGNEAGAIELTWTAQTGTANSEAKYQYRRKLTSATWPATAPFGWTDIADGPDADSDYHNESALRITGLTAGAQYNIELRFHWSNAIGPSAAAAAETASASNVPTPASFSAATGSNPGEIDLTWNVVANARYEYRTKLSTAADSTYSAWASAGSGTTYTITGLMGESNYTIQLRAQVTGVGSSPVTTATAQAQSQPGPQTYITTQGTNAGEIDLSWTAPSAGTVQHYEFRYKLATASTYPTGSATGAWAEVPDSDGDNLQSDETSYTITSLLGGLSYNVQLRARTIAGYSLPTTSTRTATPVAAPTNFSAARGTNPGEIDLAWTALASSALPTDDSVVQYQYRFKLVSSSGYSNWTNIPPANTTSHTISGLISYTAYDIELRAAIDDGDDADSVADYHSSAASVTNTFSGLDSPTGLTAVAGLNVGEVDLEWNAQTEFGPVYTGAKYQVRYKLTSASWPTTGGLGWTDISGSNYASVSHTLTGLLADRRYDIQLRFLPNSSLTSAATSTTATPPGVPVPRSVAAVTSESAVGAIHLSWTRQTDTTNSEAKHQVRYKLVTGSWPATASRGWMDVADGSDADSHTYDEIELLITGLTAGETYNIELRFHWSDSVGVSPSAAVRATASAIPTPANFSASTGTGAGEIDLTWTAVANATDYQYRCQPAGTGCTTTWQSAGTGTSHTVLNLSGGEFYNLQLRARVTGFGESSPTSSQRAQAQVTPGPATLTFSQGPNPGDIKIDWTAPANNAPVTHYEYRYKLASASDSAYPVAYTMVADSDSDSDLSDETTATITGLQPGASYHVQFRVFASQSIGYSLPQRETQAARPVAAPAGFAAAIGSNPGTIAISWTVIPASALPTGDSVVRYQYRTKLYGADASTYTTWTNIPGSNATSYTITGLTSGIVYDVQLRAAIDDGDDADSAADYHSAVATGFSRSVLDGPANFRASAGIGAGRIDLTWTAQTTFGPAFNLARYHLRYKPSTEDWPTTATLGWAVLLGSNHLSAAHTVIGLSTGQAYDFELRFAPTGSLTSPVVAARATPLGVPAPQDFSARASATTVAAIDLSWTKQVATANREAKYQVRYKLTTDPWPSRSPYGWRSVPDGPDAGSRAHNEDRYSITRLRAGFLYDIELRFHWSNEVGVSPVVSRRSAASRVPTPQGFKAVAGAVRRTVELSWEPVTGATSYEYRCNPAGESCSQRWDSAGSGTSFTIQGLGLARSYNFELRAITADGRSPVARATARAQRHPGPRNIRFCDVSMRPGEVHLGWDGPAQGTVSEYQYRYKLSSDDDSGFTAWTQAIGSDGYSSCNWVDGGSGRYLVLTSLLGGRKYDFQLRGKTADNEFSVPIEVSHELSPVRPPSGFTAKTGDWPGGVWLSWVGVGIYQTSACYDIRWRRGDDDWPEWLDGPFYFVTSGPQQRIRFPLSNTGQGDLFGGAVYTFEVRTSSSCIYYEGSHGPSASVFATARPRRLPAPDRFTAATSVFPGAVELDWEAVTWDMFDSATGYEYRIKATTASWPDDGGWITWTDANLTGATAFGLTPGIAHNVELRAWHTNIGRSRSEVRTVVSGADEFTAAAELPGGYAVDTAPTPGALAITLPGTADPFMYRTQATNPGQWSHWVVVEPEASATEHIVTGLKPGVEYNVELHVYLGIVDGFTMPLAATAVEALDLKSPSDFAVEASSGTLVLKWKNPNDLDVDRYEYRQRVAGTAAWSDWTAVDHAGARGAQQQLFITDVESGKEYQFELRIQLGENTSSVVTAGASSRVRLPEINSITPEVREVTVKAGTQIRLGVDLYNLQDVLDNDLTTDLLVFRWSEDGSGGGSFGTPDTGRQVVYTAPNSPGTYTVKVEAQPDGICMSHHAGTTTITDANRAPCIATITVTVTSPPAVAVPQPDPINPPGIIPTSLTDNEGIGYTVFTPAAGGTFTGESVTVSAPAGAVPDRSLLGISAGVSGIPTPAPVPGASMTLAGRYYDINAITQAGTAPLTSYTLDEPLMACLPYPDEFRADLSNVVLVQRTADGELGILSTTVRTTAGILTICGAVSTLPATIGVAKLGTVPATPPTPMPEEETPDTGGSAPSATMVVLSLISGLLLFVGAIVLAGIYNSVRRNSSLATLPTFTAIRRVGRTVRV